MTKMHRTLLVVALLLTAATAAEAGIFTVTLTNGTSFDTRYRPVEADWDSSVVMIRTDTGNWIAIKKNEISDVVSQIEESGFGYQLNTTTLFLGWTPNDIGPSADDEEGGVNADGSGGGGGDADDAPYLYGDEGQGAGFSLEQFVDIPDEGTGIGGVGLGGTAPSGEPNG